MAVIEPTIANAIRNNTPKPRVPKPAPAPVNPLAPVLTNPGVVNAGLNRDDQIAQANAALNASRSQALIGFGDPGLAASLGVTVDPNTAAAATANQYSTLANLAHQQTINQRSLLNNLAGRGILHSGELGYQQGEQTRAYGQALSSAEQTLLSQLNDQLSSYLNTVNGANQGYTNALLNAGAGYVPQYGVTG